MRIEINMGDLDYYSVGSKEDLYISSTLLSEIDPETGGSPQAALDFLTQSPDQKKSKAIEIGQTIHKFAESPSDFAVAEINKPTEKAGELADIIIANLKDNLDDSLIQNIDEQLIFDSFVNARTVFDFYKTRNNESTWKTFKETGAIDYIKFVVSNKNKIVLSKEVKATYENVIQSIRQHPVANMLVFAKSGYEIQAYNEKEVYWTDTSIVKEESVKFKGKLDRLVIDHVGKVIYIPDIKSISSDAYLFAPHREIIKGVKTSLFEHRKIYRQCAMYQKAITSIEYIQGLIEKGYKTVSMIVACETKNRFRTIVYEVPQTWINLGNQSINKESNRLMFHIKNNLWTMSMEECNNNGCYKIPNINIYD